MKKFCFLMLLACVSPAEASESWGGPYMGLRLGGNLEHRQATIGHASVSKTVTVGSMGGFAGYNVELGHGWIGGIEGGLDYISSANSRDKNGVTAKGLVRVGRAVVDTLIYGAVGYSSYGAVGGASGNETPVNGMLYAVGVDRLLKRNLFARLEYRFHDAGGNIKRHGRPIGKVDVDVHTFGIGLGIKF